MTDQNETLSTTPALFPIMQISTIGVLGLNFFCIFVILQHTPPKMKAYARYLLIYQIVVTSTDLTAMWLVAPWMLFPISGFLPTGPLTALGLPTEPQVVLVTVVVSSTIACTGELFFQRQQSIVPRTSWIKLKKWQIHFWHTFLICWIVFQTVVPSYFLYYNECDREFLSNLYPTLQEIVRRPEFFCLSEEYIPGASRIVKIITYVAIPILILLVGSSIFYLYRYDFRVSQRTRDMQRTMFKVLLIQTTLPLLCILGPERALAYIRIGKREDLVHWNPWIVLVVSMHGPCSTVLVLLLYAPYFEYVKGVFCGNSNKVSPASRTSHQFKIDVATILELGTTQRTRRETTII